MPQMSPMNWSLLFIFFISLMLTILYKVYFSSYYINFMKSNNLKKELNKIKWQW